MQEKSFTNLDIQKIQDFIEKNYVQETESKSQADYHLDSRICYFSLQLKEKNAIYGLKSPTEFVEESEEGFSDFVKYVEASKNTLNFQNTLLQIIADKKLDNATIYKKAGIDRKFFSKIISKKDYVPKKETVMALGLALELPFKDFEEFLASAGYAFMKSKLFDVIVEFCVKNQKFDFDYINKALTSFGEKCFFPE